MLNPCKFNGICIAAMPNDFKNNGFCIAVYQMIVKSTLFV